MLQGLGLRLWDWVWDLRLRFRGMTCPKGRAVPQTSEQGGDHDASCKLIVKAVPLSSVIETLNPKPTLRFEGLG